MKKIARLSSVALLIGVGAVACSGGAQTEETTAPTTPESTVTPRLAVTIPESTIALPDAAPDVPRMPLTGVPLDGAKVPQRPALAVKVPMDDPAAMPHSGLNKADIVYQTIINDNYTRLLAIFHSQDADPLGPIRSARDQDVYLLSAFNRPLFGWSGGNKGVVAVVRQADADGLLIDLQHGDNPGLYYRRDGRNGAPHNLFSSTEVLWSAAPPDAKPPTPVFPYLQKGEEFTGEPADQIDVVLDSIRSHWEYDPETQKYLKWNNGKPHMTENDGQVSADNVVVALMNYGVSPIDANNPLMQSLGSGPVLLFSKGKVRAGAWLRFKPESPWGFYDNTVDLKPIGLTPGRTWVELPRNSPDVVTYVAGDDTKVPVISAP